MKLKCQSPKPFLILLIITLIYGDSSIGLHPRSAMQFHVSGLITNRLIKEFLERKVWFSNFFVFQFFCGFLVFSCSHFLHFIVWCSQCPRFYSFGYGFGIVVRKHYFSKCCMVSSQPIIGILYWSHHPYRLEGITTLRQVDNIPKEVESGVERRLLHHPYS